VARSEKIMLTQEAAVGREKSSHLQKHEKPQKKPWRLGALATIRRGKADILPSA
jgi:hypothetical protein